MFRLLIADDEDLVRRGLAALIEREAPDLSIVGAAVDGLDALEMAERYQPDIMLTDIRMPGLSGLDLIGRLRDARPALHCIVLSGYDDFEYARRAISLAVDDYLLKPIDPDVLLAVLRRAQAQISAKRQDEQMRTLALAALARTQLRRLLTGQVADPETCERCLPTASAWGVLLLQAEPVARDALPASPIAELEALCGDWLAGSMLIEDLSGWYCVLAPLETTDPDRWADRAAALRQAVVEAGWDVALVAARPSALVRDLGSVYAEASAARASHPLSAKAPLLCWQLAPRRTEQRPVLPVAHTDALLQAVAEHGEDAAVRLARQLLAHLREHCPAGSLPTLYLELAMLVLHRVERSGADAGSVLDREQDPRTFLARTGVGAGPETQVLALVRRAANACRAIQAPGTARATIPALQAHIAEHLAGDLSSMTLGRLMHLNPKYLAELFKQATGEPLGEYIIRMRMGRACELLACTSLKVYTIAEQVGYTDARHFASMFRQLMSVSPGEYRDGHRDPMSSTRASTP